MKKKRIVKLEPQTVELFAEVLSKLRPPPPLTVSQWADRYRVLSAESSAEPGRWHTEKAPYQRAIMDAIGDPHVRSVVVMSAAQIGKTDAFILNPLGYYMDYVDTVAAAAPFILVKAAGWSIDKMEEPEMVDMSLIICTYQTPIRNKEEGVRDKKAPAVLDLYNIMQDIGQHFRVYNIFGDYFNVLLPIDCAIQQDDTSPYYFATVQMDVTCPSMSSENNPEIEELI